MSVATTASPTGSASSLTRSPDRRPFTRSQSIADFKVEKVARRPPMPQRSMTATSVGTVRDDKVYQHHVSNLLAVKDRQFAVSGRIPVDASQLILFFRSKSGITHSLDFPVDTSSMMPPALDVLIGACIPHQTADDDYPDQESLFYPPNLPLTVSFDIANQPILDTVRQVLFPNLPPQHHLTAVREKLEVITHGGRMDVQPVSLRNDGRSATIILTLPVRFKGGALVVHDPSGTQEKYYGRGGKSGDMEWTAFLADCEYEFCTVAKGCRVSISYAVYLKTIGSSSNIEISKPITPGDNFFDLMAPVLNLSRGRNVAFYLTHTYGLNPCEVRAESVVPLLRAGDCLLYHAIKMYKLSPQFCWAAHDYMWPAGHVVELREQGQSKTESSVRRMPSGVMNGWKHLSNRATKHRDDEPSVALLLETNGAIAISDANVDVLAGRGSEEGGERMPFISGGQMCDIRIHVLLTVFIP
ncbi:hypothetical protein BDQ17DRAFT_1244798 [Cyathus striatus]|nr:hypothetical protein BDQ17DRAFT_1244798 [Cyathus striatus]